MAMMTRTSISDSAQAAIEAHDAIYADPRRTWLSTEEAIKEGVALLPQLDQQLREKYNIRPLADELYTIISVIRALVDISRKLEEAREALEKIILANHNVPGTLINNILDIAREALSALPQPQEPKPTKKRGITMHDVVSAMKHESEWDN